MAFISPASRKLLNFLRLQDADDKQGGFVSLKSSNPFDDPLIDPNFYDSEVDLLITREAVKAAMRFAQAPVFKNVINGTLEPWGSATTDDEIDTVIRETSSTAWHPVGTASMSASNASWGVVDPDLLVKKVKGLRIVDASIMVRWTVARTEFNFELTRN